MGFKVNRKAYRLKFAEGTALDGATVVLGSLKIGEVRQYNDLLKEVQAGTQGGDSPDRDLAGTQVVAKQIADHLLEWDLEEEDGTPFPIGTAGVDLLEVPWLMLIATHWGQAMSGVDPSLGKALSSGATSLEASIPMAPNSSSQAS